MWLLIMLLVTNVSFAYNRNKCRNYLFGKSGGYNRLGISTSQFVSSTGACAAIGMNREEKAKSFYAFNNDKVLDDIAKGTGEYYLALTKLWGCKEEVALMNVKQLRSSYIELLNSEVEGQYI